MWPLTTSAEGIVLPALGIGYGYRVLVAGEAEDPRIGAGPDLGNQISATVAKGIDGDINAVGQKQFLQVLRYRNLIAVDGVDLNQVLQDLDLFVGFHSSSLLCWG